MWMLLGIGSIVFAILNVVWMLNKKDAKWFRFASMALTALTLCAFYADWGGIMDIMSTMSTALWICTFVSILINSISLFKGKE